MIDVLERFAADLRGAGIAAPDVARLTDLYDRALHLANAARWRRLYRATFFALSEACAQAAPRSNDAIESLLRLLEDDLGMGLFGAEAVARLRDAMNETSNAGGTIPSPGGLFHADFRTRHSPDVHRYGRRSYEQVHGSLQPR